MAEQKKELEVKITDELLMGRYANFMQVSHSPGEFVLDFAHLVPPKGAVVARVFVNPGKLRQIIKALQTNLEKYESKYGPVKDIEEIEGRVGFEP